MRSKLVTAVGALTIAALVLTGCSMGGDTGSDPNNPNQVETITWWASGVEKKALAELVGPARQIGRFGSATQTEAANKVIKDATAQLYKILAEGPGE